MDLASIMTGIIVMGVIGGVIAATVFAVIPWSQNEAAKKQLNEIKTAQEGYLGLSTAHNGGSGPAEYTDLTGLVDEGLMVLSVSADEPTVTADGKLCTDDIPGGYEVASRSATGAIFVSGNGKPVTQAATGSLTCFGVTP